MAFRAGLKVRFGDIDQAGSIDYPTVVLRHRIGLPTVNLKTDFCRPLRYGDHFEVEIRVVAIGQTSITWGYTTFLEGRDEVLVQGQNVTVCLDMVTFKKRDVPDWLRQKLDDYRERCE
ncbi:MAG: thioesterase family protein [Deltaproteobacteria bacterium]|nr:thioesterase family protein [Deltaproteobacteria bacterium]